MDRLTGKNDDLTVEVAQKVRDSLATLIGGARNSTNLRESWKKYVQHLNENGLLKVIAWVELDRQTANQLKREKVNITTRRSALKNRLKWLTSKIQIINVNAYHNEIDGLKVSFV